MEAHETSVSVECPKGHDALAQHVCGAASDAKVHVWCSSCRRTYFMNLPANVRDRVREIEEARNA